MTTRQAIIDQGGRYRSARLRFFKETRYVPHVACSAAGCHGVEGVNPREAGMTTRLFEGIDRLHPGDFPCAVCGSTGIVPKDQPKGKQ